jgi:hypothetical protein
MIKVLNDTRKDLLALRLEGDIMKDDLTKLRPMLELTLKEDDAKAYVEIGELDKITPNAVVQDLKNIPYYNQFSRVAIVADQMWVQALTKVSDPVMKVKMKGFDADQKNEALRWLDEEKERQS